MIVSAPASSANLGAGFDSLGLAVDIPFYIADEPFNSGREALALDAHHPAAVAYSAADGNRNDLWWSSKIPPGRGLGFSGAARVAGAYLGFLHAGTDGAEAAEKSFEVASTLEGHPDNAAASTYGGLTVAAGSEVVSVPVPNELVLVLWWPNSETSTDRSRTALPVEVPFADAVFNLSRSALFVAAVASGNYGALAEASKDRLHQERRFSATPESSEVLATFMDNGAYGGWLSGSGPTVAALIQRNKSAEFESAMSPRPVTVADIAKTGVCTVGPKGGAGS